MNKVDQFYSDNYKKLVNYVMNRKRGGDHISLVEDDAIAVVHNTYIYHRTHLNRFIPGFVWNKLSQMRKNFLRDEGIYNDMKDSYRHILDYEQSDGYEPADKEYDWWEHNALIKQEIKQHKHTEILYDHLILGLPLQQRSRDKKVLQRFKTYMVKKYGVT